VWDPVESQRACAAEVIAGSLHELARHGLVADPEGAARRVSVVASLEQAVGEADFVQESGPEVLEAKRAVFRQMDEAAHLPRFLASSTSAIVPSRFTADLRGRARCIVAHPVNPPHSGARGRAVRAPWTAASTRERSLEVMRAVGQVPIECPARDRRLHPEPPAGALLSEAFRLVEEGYVSPGDLDHTIADGLGLRLGLHGAVRNHRIERPGGVPDFCERLHRLVPALRGGPAAPLGVGRGAVAQDGGRLGSQRPARSRSPRRAVA